MGRVVDNALGRRPHRIQHLVLGYWTYIPACPPGGSTVSPRGGNSGRSGNTTWDGYCCAAQDLDGARRHGRHVRVRGPAVLVTRDGISKRRLADPDRQLMTGAHDVSDRKNFHVKLVGLAGHQRTGVAMNMSGTHQNLLGVDRRRPRAGSIHFAMRTAEQTALQPLHHTLRIHVSDGHDKNRYPRSCKLPRRWLRLAHTRLWLRRIPANNAPLPCSHRIVPRPPRMYHFPFPQGALTLWTVRCPARK